MSPLHALRPSSGLPLYGQSLPTHCHPNARPRFLTRMSDLHTSARFRAPSQVSLRTHARPPSFFLTSAETDDPVGHLLYSDHAALASGSSPTMPYSDFPGSRHSPGSLSSITAFGKMCLRPQVPLNRAVQPCSGFLQRRCVPGAGPTAAVAWRNSRETRASPGSAQVCPPWGRPVAPGSPSLPSPSQLPRPHRPLPLLPPRRPGHKACLRQ